MKTLIKLTITTATILLSANSIAANPLSDNQLYGQCKNLAKGQFADIKKVKMVDMKNTRGTFKAKFRVISKNDRGMFLCTLKRDQDPSIVRLDGASSLAVAK